MSHLTDGEIHVHLDGATDLLPHHRAVEIREHLSRCEDCQARLEEERRIRHQASEILGGAAAGAAASEPPPFESIRERATGAAGRMPSAGAGPIARQAESGEAAGPGRTRTEKSSSASRESRYRGLAWAATVVLSLGIGWYAHSGVVESDVRARPTLTAPSNPADVTAPSSQRPPIPAAAELARTAESTREGGETTEDEAPTGASPAGGGETTDEARLAARSAPGQAGTREGAGAFTSAEGAALVEGSLAVPGLPVASVAWNDTDDGGQEVTVVQRLPAGGFLTLHYTALTATTGELTDGRAVGADPLDAEVSEDRIAAPRAEAFDQTPVDLEEARADTGPGSLRPVTLRRGPWHLEAAAPIPSDSVRVLLNRLPPLP